MCKQNIFHDKVSYSVYSIRITIFFMVFSVYSVTVTRLKLLHNNNIRLLYSIDYTR